jgi:hypothetical protein
MSFRKLEGDLAILRQSGVFKEAPLYEWDSYLFAAHSGGYVKLHANGTTSKNGLYFDLLKYEPILYSDRFGRLAIAPGADRVPVISTPSGIRQLEARA